MTDITSRLSDLSPERRKLLALKLKQKAAAGSGAASAGDGPAEHPASFAQRRLWLLDRLQPGSPAYNMPGSLRFRGAAVDAAALERAVGEVVRRHQTLRTRLETRGDEPVQVVLAHSEWKLETVDLTHLPHDQAEAELSRLAQDDAVRPFRMEADVLFRALMVRLADDDVALLWTAHHAVSDGWSTGVLAGELTTLYQAFAAGEESPLPPLSLQYGDHAAAERERLSGEALQRRLAFWRQELAGAPAMLELPTDRPRPAAPSGLGARHEFALVEGAAVEAFARETGATPFMVLLAAYLAVLSRWSGQDDVVVGTPIANRPRPELEPLVGFFANTLALRGDLSGDPSFRVLVGRVREATLGAFEHQDLPFEKLVEELQPERSLSLTPFFQVMFVLQNAGGGGEPTPAPEGLRLERVRRFRQAARFDLVLTLQQFGDAHIGIAEYSLDLFDEATVERLVEHVSTLLDSALETPDAPLSTLEMLEADERAALIAAGSATAEHPVTQTLAGLFAEQVARTPFAVAVTLGGREMTYHELDEASNRLAHHLRRLGARPDSLVGLSVERSLETVVGILGILKSGAGYLPLDPAYPEDRLAYMVEDSGVSIVVSTGDLADGIQSEATTVVRLDADADAIAAESADAPEHGAGPDSLAYVIYTSGSTGKPKGVEVTHANVVRLFSATDHWFGFGAADVWTLFHSYAFDFSVWEIWGALLYGGRLVVVPFDVSRSPEDFYALLETEGVTVLNQTPSAFRQLMRVDEEAALRGEMKGLALRHVVFGGEALDPATLRGWVERRGDESPRLVNMYGITETTVHVTYREIRRADVIDGSASPIGVPIPDLSVHLLDRDGRLVPIGVVGEMYVGGGGVARGYLNRPELTGERFVRDPFSADASVRLYRSGDLARRLADGSLLFHGRADDQVKVRGFRIELGEIESALLDHATVREAVVLTRGEGDDKRLVAWVVPAGGAEVSAADLRTHLGARLPEYMVPSAFVVMDALPLTRNGKVDRRALPDPEGDALAGAEYVAPRTMTEEILAGMWAGLLGVERVGVRDGFFALGGHSLLATRLVSRVREALGAEVTLRSVFESATLADFAAQVDAALLERRGVVTLPLVPVDRSGDLPLSYGQERLWLMESLNPGELAYGVRHVMSFPADVDAGATARALTEVVRRHEALRTVFRSIERGAVQLVLPPAPVDLPVDDVRHLPPGDQFAAALAIVNAEAARTFDLEHGPLLRARMVRMGDRALLACVIHHSAFDGWSAPVLEREVDALVDAYSRRLPSPLPELPVQYVDWAAWQRRSMEAGELEGQVRYWRETLAGAPTVIGLPTDRPRPAVRNYSGARRLFYLPASVVAPARELARREGATLFMVLLAAYDVLLSRLAGEDDVVVGTQVAGRTRTEVEGLIGFFVNNLALRTDLSGNPSFRELVGRVRRVALDAYAHQDIPFQRLVDELGVERTLSHPPISQAVLVLQTTGFDAGVPSAADDAEPELPAEPISRALEHELIFDLREHGAGIVGTAGYSTEIYDHATAERFIAEFRRLLEALLAAPDAPISAPSLAEDERARVLAAAAGPASAAAPAPFHRLFEAVAARTPEAAAIRFAGDSISFAALNARANRIARRLRALGAGPESIVAVSLDRSPDVVAAMLAAAKAGGAFLPVDPAYPLERRAFMLADSGARVIVTTSSVAANLPAHSAAVLALDLASAEIEGQDDANLPIDVDPEGAAYVIYTSGSTGRPKGVVVPHRGIANLAAAQGEAFAIGAESRVLQFASPAFDAAVAEVMDALLNGATLVMGDADTLAPAGGLLGLLRDERVSVATLPPSVLSVLPDADLPDLRTVVSAGEAVPAEVVERWGAGRRFVNAYGPTETTVCATAAVDPAAREPVSVGRPIAGARVYVLDARAEPAPLGVPGELYVGGAGVARGYLGRAALTAERFVPDALSGEPGARLYRTGDRVRWTERTEGGIASDGGGSERTPALTHSRTAVLEFLGRADDQVKLRGFRIEPGEVEAVLREHPSVREALVIAHGEGDLRRLVAYVTPSPIDAEAVTAHAAARLPEYMVPAAVVALDAFPLTPNGKIDRRALPDPELAGEAYVAPRTATEKALARIWEELLEVERVGAADSFFALGGHSLLATGLVLDVREVMGVEIPMRAVFEHPTLAALAAEIDLLGVVEDEAPIRRGTENDLPLSFAQERLWFIDRLEPGSALYNMPTARRMRGPLDVKALERALAEVVRRHESLRTRFALVDGVPVQRIEPALGFRLPVDDLTTLTSIEVEDEIVRRAGEFGSAPFDLEAGPLFRARLLRVAEDDHVFLMVMHHSIADGWSMGIFWSEAVAFYRAFSGGEPARFPEPAVRYADFAAWQREWLSGERLEKQTGWWRDHLSGAPAVLELPTDRPRPPVQSHRGASVPFRLPAEVARAVTALAERESATGFMVMLAAWSLLLSRWSGQDDVVVGTPVAGRTRAEVEAVIGFFVNTLPIRTSVDGGLSFRQLLAGVREATLGAFAHQEFPFERMVEELAPRRSLSHAPIFQTQLVMQNVPEGSGEGFAGIELDGVGRDEGRSLAKVDLTLTVLPADDEGMIGGLSYAADLWDAATVERMTAHLATLLASAVESPDAPVSTLEMLDAGERAALVAAASATAAHPVARTIPDLFAEQAARTPEATAVTLGGRGMTYRELDQAANRLANHLRKLGARPDSLVGLCVERSLETVVGILGIVKAGAGYLPLDPAYPEDRLAYMVEDSGVSIVVSTASLADGIQSAATTIVRLDADADAIAAESADAPEHGAAPESLAYVIYTSGSTGKPKGVQVTHANVVRLFTATDHWFGFGEADVWTLFHSYAFDFSVWEIWGALLYGGRLVVVPFDVSRSPEEFYALLETEGVTVLNQTPSAFRQLMRADEEAASRGEMRGLALRYVVFGGEALDPATLRGWVERRGDESPLLVNMYGITETTVHVTYREIREADVIDGSSSPIGVPIPDLSVHLLDRNGRLVPTGIVGEMYVGGGGVARGYLNRPELTAQRFVRDPFSDDAAARLYRSGDLARRLPDGSLEFQGRADDQVKVRGFRIELGEIESALLDHPAVREAVVLTRGEGDEKRLVAWVVPASGAEVTAADLRTHLGAHLPEYMVPSAFVVLRELPLTRNGKVDRAALPEPEGGALSGAAYVAPRTQTEEVLAAMWAGLLGVERVGADDGFFELGGHSLLATRVASRVREELGVELPVRAVFEHSTLGALAAEVDRLRRGAGEAQAPPIVPVPRDGDLPLSFAQERMWFVDRMEAWSPTYHMPMSLRLRGELDEVALRRAVDELVRRHESLRTTFPLVDGLPVQRVSPPGPAAFTEYDLTELRDDERAEEAAGLVRENATVPFSLEAGPLFRVELVKMAADEHLLLVNMHHIISDGWSLDVLWRELAALYAAFSAGRPSPLAPPKVQYADFAAWQRGWLKGDVLERELAYWRAALAGAPAKLELPTDRPRPAVQTHHGAVEGIFLPRESADAVLALARKEGATLFMLLLAAFDLVLSRVSGQDDVVVGTPIAGRTRAETEGVIGLFLNSLALRVKLAGNPTFRELLARVRETTLEAYAHQDVPFERILEEVQPERSTGHTPVFQVMLNLANFGDTAAPAAVLPGLEVGGVGGGGDAVHSKFDMTLYAGERPDGLGLRLVYNTDLFDGARARALLGQLAAVLGQAADDPTLPVGSFSLADEDAVAADAERAVRTAAGLPAGVGEPGEVWEKVDGEWRATGARGRLRPDGAVDLLADAADVSADDEESAAGGALLVASADLLDEMLAIWREILEDPEILPDDDFFDLGGHSLLGVRLLAMVKTRLGRTLALPALFANPTPARLAAEVEAGARGKDYHHLVPLRAEGSREPVFCVHPAGGTVFCYLPLAELMQSDHPFYGVQAAGVVSGEPLRTVDQMAERYVDEIRRLQPQGPYYLCGWSAGGIIAFEMASRIRAAGEEVAFLGLFDVHPPALELPLPDPVSLYRRLATSLSTASETELEELMEELDDLTIDERLPRLAEWLKEHAPAERVGELEELRHVVEVTRATIGATRRHVLQPYDGHVTFFAAEWARGQGWEAAGYADVWRPYVTGRLDVVLVPGLHTSMVRPPYVFGLAEAVDEVLRALPSG